MRNLRKEFEEWVEVEEADFRARFHDSFPSCHPDELAVRIPERFHPLLDLEPTYISQGQYLTSGYWFFPTDGEVERLSYHD